METYCRGGVTLYDGLRSGDINAYGPGYYNYVGDFMNDRASSIGFYASR